MDRDYLGLAPLCLVVDMNAAKSRLHLVRWRNNWWNDRASLWPSPVDITRWCRVRNDRSATSWRRRSGRAAGSLRRRAPRCATGPQRGAQTARRRRLLEACVIDDVSRNEIGRCLGVDHKTARVWTITAIKGLALVAA